MSNQDESRHEFDDNESVIVPSKQPSPPQKDLWPAEKRLYHIFPDEEKYRGEKKSKRSSSAPMM